MPPFAPAVPAPPAIAEQAKELGLKVVLCDEEWGTGVPAEKYADILGLPNPFDEFGFPNVTSTGLRMEYLKKARGTITGICECPIVSTNERHEYAVPHRAKSSLK